MKELVIFLLTALVSSEIKEADLGGLGATSESGPLHWVHCNVPGPAALRTRERQSGASPNSS